MINITRHITDRQNIITSRSSIIMLCLLIITLSLLNITFLTGTILGIPISTVSALSYQSSTDVSFTFNPILSISVSPDSITTPTIAPGTTATSNIITVNVSTNTAYGYSLLASVGNNTQYNTSDLIHSDSTIDSTFTSIATNASLPQLDTDNTWGYSFSSNHGATWSTYHGLPLYSTVGDNTETNNPALLIDTTSPADNRSIDFRIAARASSTQPSGTYSNVINFYAVGKPAPPTLYEEVAKMSKGTQTLADLQVDITYPTSRDYHEDTSNSGVYEYDSTTLGAPSDASNNYKIYYYRGVLEPEADQGTNGDGRATTYPNYVKLDNNTCWRIVRTTGSGGVKMIYNGTWSIYARSCANGGTNAEIGSGVFHSAYTNAVYVGYTFNADMRDRATSTSVDTVFGNNNDIALNNRSSTIKTYIEDTWYHNNMTAYTSLLESDAGYCNDRSVYSDISGTQPTEVVPAERQQNVELYFGSYMRLVNETTKTVTLNCPRGDVDIYRYVSNSTSGYTGNELRYPAALLTADEMALAGNGYSGIFASNPKAFLNSASYYGFWSLSPHSRESGGNAREFVLKGYEFGRESSGKLNSTTVYGGGYGIRPVISLKPGTGYVSGSGTSEDPWVVPAL